MSTKQDKLREVVREDIIDIYMDIEGIYEKAYEKRMSWNVLNLLSYLLGTLSEIEKSQRRREVLDNGRPEAIGERERPSKKNKKISKAEDNLVAKRGEAVIKI